MNLARARIIRICLALVFAAALPIIGSLPASAHTSSKSLPILRYDAEVGNPGWPQSLDPALGTDGYSIGVFDLVYAGIYKLNYHTYQDVPDVASHYKVSKNHKTYWFYLRKNARFSNGDPVTAQDEVWTLTRMLAKSTNSPVAMPYFGHIVGAKKLNSGKTNKLQGVKALGRYVLQVKVDAPLAYFLKTFAYWSNKVLDPRVVAGHKPGVYLTNDCSAEVGAGPFMFKCRNKSSNKSSFYPPGSTPTITLVPNPYYYGRHPHIELVIRPYATYDTGYDAYRANQIDLTPLPAADVAQFRHSSQLREFPAPSTQYLLPNMKAAPFNNVHCRLAVAYAINQNALDNIVLHRSWRPIYSFVPKPIAGAYAGNDNPHYNPAKAKAELAQCPGGIHNIPLPYYKSGTDADNEFVAIQNMLSQVGITVKPVGLPVDTWLTDVEEPENTTHNSLVQLQWGMDFPDAEDFCTLLLRGGETYDVGQYNDPTYNRLVDAAEVNFNPVQRTKMYIRAQHMALSTGAAIMLGQQVQDAVVKPWVHGLIAAYGNSFVTPVGGSWANVTISKH